MITAKWLRERRACEEQVSLFEKTFPDGCEVSRKSLAAARKAGLDVCWVAANPATPKATLAALAGDENAYVRAGVAWNPATPRGGRL